MSTSTTFKRIALVAVASLGLGVLSSGPSMSVVSAETLTATPSATSVAVGDSLTITIVNEFTSTAADTSIINYNITAPAGGSAPTALYSIAVGDTVNALSSIGSGVGLPTSQFKFAGVSGVIGMDTLTAGSGVAKYNKATASLILQAIPSVGTYYVSVYTTGADGINVARKSVNFSFTVTRSTISGVRLYVSTDTTTAFNARLASGPAVDSSIAVSAGLATAPKYVATLYATGLAAGDTVTSTGSNVCTTQALGYCSVTVTVSGPGLVSLDNAANPSKSATMKLYNGTGFSATGETLTIYSDGTAGTGTITFSNGTTTYATKTMTFFGAAASATLYYGDTTIAVGATSAALKAYVKDSGGNTFTGDIYLYSSDTKIISESATACSYSTTLGYHSCTVTGVDTGTATVKVSNTATQSAAATTTTLATWFSSTLSWTVRGTKIQSFTATFDKATYVPGEKAVLTITAKDRAGNSMANGSITSAFTVVSNRSFTDVAAPTTFAPGTSGLEDGVETRVVYMPTTGGDFTYTIGMGANSWTKANDQTFVADVVAKASVVDPSQTAQNTAIANAQAAADAATDAALQAIDAANAATDAANLAAEAADAATVAAQESKDSADAATAAVESLATQVATLMAALQAQITSLANVVAKIAKKVKA